MVQVEQVVPSRAARVVAAVEAFQSAVEVEVVYIYYQ
jgi:hypothetical protein